VASPAASGRWGGKGSERVSSSDSRGTVVFRATGGSEGLRLPASWLVGRLPYTCERSIPATVRVACAAVVRRPPNRRWR